VQLFGFREQWWNIANGTVGRVQEGFVLFSTFAFAMICCMYTLEKMGHHCKHHIESKDLSLSARASTAIGDESEAALSYAVCEVGLLNCRGPGSLVPSKSWQAKGSHNTAIWVKNKWDEHNIAVMESSDYRFTIY